jgi:ACS family hexuronate transporter-like MFS transporter
LNAPAISAILAGMNFPNQTGSATGKYRWVICGLLFWVTTANYIDRGVFGNLAPELQKEIGWTAGQYWYMQVAFNAAYAVSLLVVGRLIDVIGLRWGFALACGFWGLASMSHSLAGTVTGFFICRILLALGEGGNFPAAIKTTAEWFPKRERALATGIFNSGSNVGGLLVPLLLPLFIAWLNNVVIGGHRIGWRGAFLVTGLFDLLWIIAWLNIYKKPAQHPRVSPAELALINSEPPEASVKIPWSRLFQFRQAWSYVLGKFMTDCFWWFYLFGAPVFFAERFGTDLKGRMGPLATIYVLASFGSIGGGWLSGFFMKRGWTANKSRKVTMLICAACVFPVAFATISDSIWISASLIALAAAAHQAWSANIFSLASDMFPRRVVASVTGLGGMAGSIGGILLFLVVGCLKDRHISYVPIFIAASLGYLLALGVIQLLAPKLEPANVDEPQVA